jgi:hypothetical protein
MLREMIRAPLHQPQRLTVIGGRIGPCPREPSRPASTPGQAIGTSTPTLGSRQKSHFASGPFKAAVKSARVARFGMPMPAPQAPPVHPVLTSQQVAPCLL